MEPIYPPSSYMYQPASLKQVVANLLETDLTPEDWKKLCPRRIAGPQNYVRHELISMIYASQYLLIKQGVLANWNWSNSSAAIVANALMQLPLRIPTWYLGEDLLLAILQTDFPEELTFQELKLPMPGFTLMLPMTARSYRALGDRYLPFMQFSMVPKDRVEPGRSGQANDMYVLFFSIQDRNMDPSELTLSARPEDRVNRYVQDELEDLVAEDLKRHPGIKLTTSTPERDREAMQLAFRILVGTLAIMTSRPGLVETQTEPCRKEKKNPKGQITQEELWHPNFIGRSYRMRSEVTEAGTHASPRMHWRRGHMRDQPHGPGRTLHKMIWLEPVLINPPKTEGP